MVWSIFLADDIWIISKTLSFNPDSTFVASSVYYGPSSGGELELSPIRSVAIEMLVVRSPPL